MSSLDVANSEKNATSAVSGVTNASAPPRKVRSCFVCRQRKVKCDKRSPCGNCRRANIPCVLPPAERPPRWARRQELLANNAEAASQAVETGDAQLIERLRYLEALVQDLSDQLRQARSNYGSSTGPSPGSNSHNQDEQSTLQASPVESDGMGKQFGRLVVQDSGQTRYVSSGFWSRIDDELDALDTTNGRSQSDQSAASDDETSPEKSADGANLLSHMSAFPFQLSPMRSDSDLRSFGPLPSQIPFLVEVFSESIYIFLSIVHLPSIKKTVQDIRRGGTAALSASHEALMFAVYHSAIVSMEEEEVVTNFGEAKLDILLRYRRGMENAFAKADFLNSPDTTLLQAFALFLFLARCYDSPRYVWMMTGLLIRMAHYVGLQRDGSQFNHLSPYEIEMRRRVWWAVVLLDVRASEDQGTDTIIKKGSFDTRLPLNINDTDIDPQTKVSPVERSGVTDLSTFRATSKIAQIAIQIASIAGSDDAADQERTRLLDGIYESFNQEHLQHDPEPGGVKYLRRLTVVRINQGKLTLLAYLPVLFSSPTDQVSQELRSRLLVAAIEVAEYNHWLHTEEGSRNLNWIWDTYTHWYAIVFLLIETSRGPWLPIIERAWSALHSEGLFPRPSSVRSNLRIWIPVRKMMQKARKHRESEIQRLRADPLAVATLAAQDQQLPHPSSLGLFQSNAGADTFRERWRSLVTAQDNMPMASTFSTTSGQTDGSSQVGKDFSAETRHTRFDRREPHSGRPPGNASQLEQHAEHGIASGPESAMPVDVYNQSSTEFDPDPHRSSNMYGMDQSTYNQSLGAWPGFANWLWTDIDPSLDDFTGVDMDLDMFASDISVDPGANWLN